MHPGTTAPSIGFHRSLQRYRADKRRSHFDGTSGELVNRVRAAIVENMVVKGKREGTFVVSVSPDKFYSGEGVEVVRDEVIKVPAVRAEVVLYTYEAIVNSRSGSSHRHLKPGCDYYIVAVHGYLPHQ